MEYEELAKAYDLLEKTPKRLKKTSIISSLISKTKDEDLGMVLLLLRGRVFPDYEEREIGVASRLVLKAISTATGYGVNQVERLWSTKGDLGLVAESLIAKKSQNTLFSSDLSVRDVFGNLQKLAVLEGQGSVDQKVKLIASMLSSAKPMEAKYIVRSVLQDLRVGVADGTLRDAIAWSCLEGVKPNYDGESESIKPDSREEYNEAVGLVQRAIDKTNDFGLVARIARKGRNELEGLKLVVGKPVKVMLAQKAATIQEAFKAVGTPAAIEYKYDGFRMLVSKQDDEVKIFTRRLEEVTSQFPEVKEYVLKNVKAKTCVLDSEAVGYNSKTGKYTAFQSISQRIKRKYGIEKMAVQFPVELNVFDILFLEGEDLLGKPFGERRKIIESIILAKEKKIVLAKQIITGSVEEAQAFFEESVNLGNEGLMFKKLDAEYKPGSRVGYMVKYKEAMDELDLVVVGAEWGEGKRKGWLTSLVVACRGDDGFLEIGRVGTGLKEKREEGLSFDEITELLKPLIIREKGREVRVKPSVVISLRFEEIQKSPAYSSGYALRFPRVTGLRSDRSPLDIAGLEEVEDAFFGQKK